jgi:predicted ester cyclase
MAATDTTAKPMTTAQVLKAYFTAHERKDVDAVAELWSEDGRGVIHGIAELNGPNDARAYFRSLYDAFPDYRFEILDLAASGKQGACRWRITGTFTGPGRFRGLAPTGASIELEGCDMMRVENGKVAAIDAYANAAELAQQLGMLPAEGSFADRAVTGAFNAKTAATNAIRKLRES